MSRRSARSQGGQALVLFAASLIVLLLMVGLVIDAGYGFAQRRSAQNAADFAATAGARIVGEKFTGKPAGAGTGANVQSAILHALEANGATLESAQFIDAAGRPAGAVGGAIPSNAAGVTVTATTEWRPFVLGIIGVTSWSTGADATAMTKGTASGGVLPLGLNIDLFEDLTYCDISGGCDPERLTSGKLYAPGNFGWLSFGAGGRVCETFGLGQLTTDNCEVNQGYLENEIGPPGDSHGCCTTVVGEANPYIAGLTGNVWGDLSYYVENQIPVWVPIWDEVFDPGRNEYYRIVGFGAVILTSTGDGSAEHAKWIQGVRVSDIGDVPNAFGLTGVTGEVYLVR